MADPTIPQQTTKPKRNKIILGVGATTTSQAPSPQHYHRGYQQIDFEQLINKALERAEVPLSKLFIDRVDKKTYLRKLTVRTKEGKHFRIVIGKDELMNGYEMFVVMLKAKYKEALKQPDKPKQQHPHKMQVGKNNNDKHSKKVGWKGTYYRKPENKAGVGSTPKTTSTVGQKGTP